MSVFRDRIVLDDYRERDDPKSPVRVANGIPIGEAKHIPKGQAALDSEWKKLWDMKCWISEPVVEYHDYLWKAALVGGNTIHFGRASRLRRVAQQASAWRRKYTGRVVFEG